MSSFDAAYRGVPPWDTGHPQPEFVGLAEEGEIRGSVLDVGCGTGENALYFSGLGHEVVGLDSSPRAIEKAKAKTRERGSTAMFVVGNALDPSGLDRRFDTVTDSGLFHVFSDEGRVLFERSLAELLRRGGTYFMLCFSDRQPGYGGPRRVSQGEIRDTFRNGWNINYIRDARFEDRIHSGNVLAWLSSISLS